MTETTFMSQNQMCEVKRTLALKLQHLKSVKEISNMSLRGYCLSVVSIGEISRQLKRFCKL